MDFKIAVFNAARDGNLTRLKVYLHSWRSMDDLNMLVGAKVGGTTPLVIACRNGHYDVAEYLIERCKADIEQPGSVTFDGETIEGAPPLWCAAAAGHLPLVRLLVRAGANVNSTTRTHSTPLRAACFDGHYDIVKFLVESGADIEIANRHGHTCLMIACYKGHIKIAKYLLSLNADVNRKSVKGNTALHDCAESGSLHILKLLLGYGATMDVDSYGMTPLLAASVTGHTHIVEHLINVEYCFVTRQQRIDALELLGATYVDKRRDMVGALALWKRAMDDRFPADGSEPIPKPKDVPRIEAYDYAVEPSNAQQLDEILADPDAMRMQALVIRERILGPAHPDTSYYVRYRGAVYADAGRFSRCRQLWHHALDMQRCVLPPLSPLTQSSLYSFAELFSYMLLERARPPLRGRIVPPVTIDDVEPVFEKALSEIHRGMEMLECTKQNIDREQTLTTLQRVLVISLHLATVMAKLLAEPDCTEETSRRIHKQVYALVKLDIKVRQGRSLLHVACAGAVAGAGAGAGAGADAERLVRVLNNVCVRVLEHSPRTCLLCAIVSLLHESIGVSDPAYPRYQDLLLKCFWKTLKMISTWDVDSIDYDAVLYKIHLFYKAYPNSYWKKNPDISDTPYRTVKTLVHTLVKMKGSSITNHLTQIPDVNESDLYPYLLKVLKQLKLDEKKENTADALNGSSIMGGVGIGAALSGNVALSAGRLPRGVHEELALILKRIGSKEHNKDALSQLYDLRERHPEVDIWTFMQGSSFYFRNYVERGLREVAEQRKMATMPIYKHDYKNDNIDISNENDEKSHVIFLERLRALQAKAGLKSESPPTSVPRSPAAGRALADCLNDNSLPRSHTIDPQLELHTTQPMSQKNEAAVDALRLKLQQIKSSSKR